MYSTLFESTEVYCTSCESIEVYSTSGESNKVYSTSGESTEVDFIAGGPILPDLGTIASCQLHFLCFSPGI